MFWDKSVFTVPTQHYVLIYKRCSFFALAVAFPFALQLPIGDIAVGRREIYIRGVSIMIQFPVMEGIQKGTQNVR